MGGWLGCSSILLLSGSVRRQGSQLRCQDFQPGQALGEVQTPKLGDRGPHLLVFQEPVGMAGNEPGWSYGEEGERWLELPVLNCWVLFSSLSAPSSTSKGKELCPCTTVSAPGKYGRPLKKANCWSLFVLGWEGLLVNKYILIMRENWYANEGHHWQALDGRGRALHSCGLAWRSQGCAWPFVGCFLGVKTSFPNKSVKEGTGPGGDFRIFCLHTS